MIAQINEVWSVPCRRISHSWHLWGLTDAALGCSSRSQPGSPVKPRIWLAVETEPDGNWLHITCLLQLKKVSSRWGIRKVWEQKRRGHPYLSQQPSSRSVHCQQALRGEGSRVKGRWLTERGPAWQLNRADSWLKQTLKDRWMSEESDLLDGSRSVVHWWSGIIIFKVPWVHGVCPRLW